MNLRTLCLTALAFLPFSVSAQEAGDVDLKAIKHPVKPMLWKIEGNGLKKPSYLFGTIHLSDSRLTTLHPTAQKAFDEADTVYAEIDLSPQNQVAALPFLIRKDDKTLKQIIGNEMSDALDAELKAVNPALNSVPFQKMKVWAVSVTLPQLKGQLEGKKALDLQLWERAQKAGKKTGALETLEDQLGKLDQFTEAEQVDMLGFALKTMKAGREQGINPHQSIIDGYLLADREALKKEMTKTSHMGFEMNANTQKKFLRLLLEERNKGMADSVKKALTDSAEESHFFAAGTLHYLGDDSVNKLLTEAGYQVTFVAE